MEDRIISALIGLIGACQTNPKTENTDRLIVRALAATAPSDALDSSEKARETDNTGGTALSCEKIVNDIHAEKYRISPGCATCASPCGNTSDYDMNHIDTAEEDIRASKLLLLSLLRKAAVQIDRLSDKSVVAEADYAFFYKALALVSYDLEKDVLLRIVQEAKDFCDRIEQSTSR